MNQADFAAFADRQNCPYEAATNKESQRSGLSVQRFVWENGAMVQVGVQGATFYDPPDASNGGLWALLSLKREYLSSALSREEKAWHTFRQECLQAARFASQYRNLPPPPANAEAQLEAGRERVLVLREKLADIDRQLAEEPGRKAKAERERTMAELEQDRQAITAGRLQAIRSMSL
jgi:hypothetical protein